MSIDFIVCAPSYNEKHGGIIVLHELCKTINKLNCGHRAFMLPTVDSLPSSPFSIENDMLNLLIKKQNYKKILSSYITTDTKLNPIYPLPSEDIFKRENCVVIYPEIVFGNPFKAKNVARWLLHNPGVNHNETFFERHEIQFKFSDQFEFLNNKGICINDFNLKIISLPFDVENLSIEDNSHRDGVVYCIRKGKNRFSDLSQFKNKLVIDNLPLNQIIDLFGKIKTFVSFDTHTFLSQLAAIKGADSIVIPIKGVSKKEWSPDPSDSYGVAYGIDDLDNSKKTLPLLIEKFRNINFDNQVVTKKFINYWDQKLKKKV